MIALAYDHDGSRLVKIELQVGDLVEWKQQGRTGSWTAVVERFSKSGGRVGIYLTGVGARRWVMPRFLSVTRNGRRLP